MGHSSAPSGFLPRTSGQTRRTPPESRVIAGQSGPAQYSHSTAMSDDQLAPRPAFSEKNAMLAREWRKLSRIATFVAILTGPAFFAVLVSRDDWSPGWALLVTILAVAAFRGLIDIIAHKLIPRASLYTADREALLD